MTHSPSIDLYRYPSKNASLNMPPSPPSTVHGWLMGVPGYRESSPDKHKNEQIPQEQQQSQKRTMTGTPINSISNGDNLARRKSISSIASEDSVNLDDLIKDNYTLDMDDETDLPNLSGLDLDDSNEDFWKLDKSLPDYQSLLKQTSKADYLDTSHSDAKKENLPYIDGMNNTEQQEYNIYIKNCHLDSPELTWSPPDDHLETRSPSANSSHNNNNNIITNSVTRARSGSINSDNSLNSYSTITASQYSRYGMAPMIYQSDSTSTSSRTASRLSNYSASSQTSSNTASTGLPRPRKISSSSTGMSSPSRSFNSREESHLLPRAHSRLGTSHLPTTNEASSSTTNGRSRLAKRASHIPSPSSANTVNNNNMTSLPRLTSIPSSKSTGIPGGRSVSRFGEREGTSGSRATTTTTVGGSTTSRKLASRASHIPSLHERSSSPSLGKSSAHSTIRNSVFGSRRDDDSALPQTTRRGPSTSSSNLRSPNQQRQGVTPQSGKSTGLRPPTDTRSASRIGLRKA
ncbi:hypothetical protein BCR42DRAFT_424469 [Absidia repens]|uniref:Uncharacterized protein n=1 Tax=Absidia repens TaxID=90262 RepID=A0A1X2I486_9FUNG|nr:hypothetical protein BCR42DRAFT_424469 [Absidia repens]